MKPKRNVKPSPSNNQYCAGASAKGSDESTPAMKRLTTTVVSTPTRLTASNQPYAQSGHLPSFSITGASLYRANRGVLQSPDPETGVHGLWPISVIIPPSMRQFIPETRRKPFTIRVQE